MSTSDQTAPSRRVSRPRARSLPAPRKSTRADLRALLLANASLLDPATIRAYGVLDAARNVAWRSTFVIDRDGLLRWGQAGDREMVRDGAEVIRVLDLIARLRKVT